MSFRVLKLTMLGSVWLATLASGALGAPSPPTLLSQSSFPYPGVPTLFGGSQPRITEDGSQACFVPGATPSDWRSALVCWDRLPEIGDGAKFHQLEQADEGGLPTPVAVSGDGKVAAYSSSSGPWIRYIQLASYDPAAGYDSASRRLLPPGPASRVVGISQDGRLVLTWIGRTDLVLVDAVTGQARTVARSAPWPLDARPQDADLSADGRFVAFSAYGGVDPAHPLHARRGVYIRDMNDQVARLVSVAPDGSPGDADSWAPTVSDDGRFVGFASSAANLVAGDSNRATDVFVRDRSLGTTARVSTGPAGVQLGRGGEVDGESDWMSGDGRVIAFRTTDRALGGDEEVYQCWKLAVVDRTGDRFHLDEFPPAFTGSCPAGTSLFSEFALSRTGRHLSYLAGGEVYFRDLGNFAPQAVMTVGDTSAPPVTVNFDAAASNDRDGSVVTYRWDFGDGATATGPRVAHTFDRSGDHRVLLTVTDNEGAEGRAERIVTVPVPALRLENVSARATWVLGRAVGRVALTGTSDRAARINIRLERGGTRLRVGAIEVPRGRFTKELSLPAAVRPGRYRVSAQDISPGIASLQEAGAVLSIAPPRLGIVDRASAIDLRGRRVGPRRPLGTRSLRAGFRMVVPPAPGVRVEAVWSMPDRAPYTDPSPKRRRGGYLTTGLGSPQPLAQGVYICRLRIGGTTVATVRLRVG